jgi:glycosyltransferase involved in cell wall biosynthesis
MNAFRWSFPISSLVMESLNWEDYDVVLSSAATLANYVKAPKGRHLCYRYMPTRAIWMFDEYFGSAAKKKFVKWMLPSMRKRDYAAAQRVDRFIAISKASQTYIKRFYSRDSDVVYSPIDVEFFKSRRFKRGDHFLMVSRLEKWKSVDYAIQAFSELGLPLRVVGTGNEEVRLRQMAASNITFIGEVNDEQLAREYAEARALIFTPEIEYGLIPLEAAASGTPVICFASVGVKETMVPYTSVGQMPEATAIFYPGTDPRGTKEGLGSVCHRRF